MPKTKKIAKWRKSLKALKRVKVRKTRFTTKMFYIYNSKGSGKPTGTFVRIYDNKVKQFIRGDWELEHALAVLGHLLENPDAAKSFGYVK
jgi:hypothetical protein